MQGDAGRDCRLRQCVAARCEKLLGFARPRSYVLKREYDSEIADCTAAIALGRANADLFATRGVAYDRKGDADRTIADYTEAIRVNPKSATSYCYRT